MAQQQALGDRYAPRRVIGRGGMADVYLARDTRLERDVAVKVLRSAFSADPEYVERFRREARAIAALNHPNIVAIYDWGQTASAGAETAGEYYLVMEYVPGPNLKERIGTDGALPEDEALGIAAEIAAALEAAHARGLIHRDIKPHNVLLSPAGTVKVTDFGIAYLEGLTHLTRTHAVSGTAHYISPEQAQGHRVDRRTDLYSLGVVLHEMLAGRVPFEGEALVDVALRHVQEGPPPLRRLNPAVSAATAAVVARALAKDPAQRFADAAQMRAALLDARAALHASAARIDADSSATTVVEQVRSAPARTKAASGSRAAAPPNPRRYAPQDERGSRWWLLAVPLLLLALLGGALALHALSPAGKSAAPPTVGRHATPASHAVVPTVHPSATPRPSATPAPTTVPTHAALVATAPPAAPPTASPTAAPTAPPTTAPIAAGAGSPQSAVLDFYRLVTQHRYADAAGLWSSAMRSRYPPATNIAGRFDLTRAMDVRITSISRQGDGARVGVALAEQRSDGTVNGFTGSWTLIHTASGWLLDSVNLTPAPVDAGSNGHGNGNGNGGGDGGNG